MKISSIRRAGIFPVYNMSVKEHHNFMIGGNIILHNCDGIRYYCVSRVLPAEAKDAGPAKKVIYDDDDDARESYDDFMCGGEITTGYLVG